MAGLRDQLRKIRDKMFGRDSEVKESSEVDASQSVNNEQSNEPKPEPRFRVRRIGQQQVAKVKKPVAKPRPPLDRTSERLISENARETGYKASGGAGNDILWSPSPLGESQVLSYAGGENIGLNKKNDANPPVRQINVGFDFGSSSVKCVLRLSKTEIIPVAFTDSKQNPWILPGRVARSPDGEYRLTARSGDDVLRNLKIPLLAEDVDEEVICHAAGYLALAMRCVRAYFYHLHAKDYPGHLFVWIYNVGIPAPSVGASSICERYDRILQAAHTASCQSGPINDSLIRKALAGSLNADDLPVEIYQVPEVVAQVHEMFSSGIWDPSQNLVAVMDVGAGTVDAAVFVANLQVGQGASSVAVIGIDVKLLGVANFNSARVRSIRDDFSTPSATVANYLDSIEGLADIANSLPEHWYDYIGGYVPSKDADDIDRSYGNQVGELIYNTANNARLGGLCVLGNWHELPLVLCGGGYNETAYRNARRNLAKSGFAVRMFEREQQRPSRVRDAGVEEGQYRYLSLAYGLSNHREDFPRYISPADVPPQDFVRKVVGREIIGAEQM